MQVENTCHSLGHAGIQMPQATVFGKMGKIGFRVHSISESFRLEGTGNFISIDDLHKPAAACDRKVIGM